MATILLTNNASTINGEIDVPGDKSISHRSIIFGSIAEGETIVSNFLLGDDCLNTIKCFKQLGVEINETSEQIIINGRGFSNLKEPKELLDVGNSGTTIRLLLGLLASTSFFTIISGDDSIGKRPMTRVTKPLKMMGADIDGRENGRYTPLSIRGTKLSPLTYELPVASAQVKSALLLASLNISGETTIIEKDLTRNHTELMIKQFGGNIETSGKTIKIKGGQALKGTEIFVPGDISSAAFFLVAAAIVPNSQIMLKNVGLNKTRTGIIDVMEQMGANISITKNSVNQLETFGNITVKFSDLHCIEIGGDIIPRLIDELPIIALLATQATGKTVIKNAEELKVKETNRIDTVVEELSKLGANIIPTADGMIIEGPTQLIGGCEVSSHGDHRIGMMLAIAALICKNDVYLNDAESIAISYPNFFRDLNNVVIK